MPIIQDMEIVEKAVDDITIPRFVKVRQVFNAPKLKDIPLSVNTELRKEEIRGRIKVGDKIAICVGSRGISNLACIVKEIVDYVKELNATPIIIPTMGSHGGATGEGQRAILADFGITEQTMGAQIISEMDVIELGTIDDGTPVYVDCNLSKADGIIIVNRVKPHPSFSGPIESGIIKMSVIGLGKQKGAETCHKLNFVNFANRLIAMKRVIFKKLPVLFGVAIVENAYDETAEINVIPAEKVEEVEPILLKRAKANMPKIFFNPIDVLIIDEIGKNISGSGADPNVTGKFLSDYKTADFVPPRRIYIRDLTKETEGSAVGMGIADFVSKKLFDKFDMAKTYINGITSTLTIAAKLPIVMRNDYYGIKAAMKTCNKIDLNDARIVRIQNTLKLEHIYISENLLDEAKNNPNVEILTDPLQLTFDENGNLVD
ncbi:MAG: hypothetical protein PWR06_135 [Thermoanaerobacteraceae bacterium]|nr:hypothetical protein [Thermoanaerobacteraceae bacterium]